VGNMMEASAENHLAEWAGLRWTREVATIEQLGGSGPRNDHA
jgi:hypothetical protein